MCELPVNFLGSLSVIRDTVNKRRNREGRKILTILLNISLLNIIQIPEVNVRNVEYTIKILTEFFNIVLHGGHRSIRTLDNKVLLLVHNADVIGSLLDRDNEFDEGAGNDVLTVHEVNSYDWGTTDGLLVVLYTISIHHLENTTQTVNALDDGLLVSRRTGTCH